MSRSKDGFCASQRIGNDGDTVVGVFIMEYYEELADGVVDASPCFSEAVMDVSAFTEFEDVSCVEIQFFGPVLVGLGAEEEKDNGLATAGKGDEIMVSKRAISFHSDIVMYSPFSTSG